MKQAIDARHIREKGGTYLGLSGRDEPTAMGAELGFFHYPSPYVEGRFGLSGLIYPGDDPLSGGALGAVRFQTPTRLAPFAGVGAYVGFTPDERVANDGLDNDHDGEFDEWDESENDVVLALVPEAGCHLWITPGWRATGAVSYLVTDNDQENNFLMFSVSLAHLSDLGKMTSQRAMVKRAGEIGWQVGDGAGLYPPSEQAPLFSEPSPPPAVSVPVLQSATAPTQAY